MASSADLREQLQAALGTSYTLERELGGGGMSHVFVATEPRLGRQVVVKVLAPERALGLSVERFNREIRLAGSLQQANIVPVLTAGEVAGLPYYTMPYVDGESLRARLASGPLPIAEAVGVLRDVARALAHAHRRGIVHRDIKPDNILLSEGAAVVTDFGIGKALEASRTNGPAEPITQVGLLVGTLAYIAPEQAVGDPEADHRADLYALGCVAFEMLTGRTPFAGRTPQRTLAAQLSEAPPDVRQLRPDTPPELAELVTSLLAKDPAARPPSASAVLRLLNAVPATDAASSPPNEMPGVRALLWRALALYAVAFVAVATIAKAIVDATGVPDWVLPGALVVMALGLPALLVTAYVQYAARRASAATSGRGHENVSGWTLEWLAVKASPHISWRRTARWGMYSLGAFAAVVAAVMALRAWGLGPEGSLVGAGTIEPRARIVVADFQSNTDTSLGAALAEAVRSDLAHSSAVSLLGREELEEALVRMEYPSSARLPFSRARELAEREGIPAIVDGDVKELGESYLLTLRLVTADSGRELVAYRETAATAGELIRTLGRMTRRLRGRIGESLKTVRESPPLEQATTSSLPALRKYTEALRARQRGDTDRAIALLREAVAIDTGFTSAYARIAVEVASADEDRALGEWAGAEAFARRSRLPEAERLLVEQFYYLYGPPQERDAAAALRAAEQLMTLRPDDWSAVNAVAINAARNGDLPRADSLMRRAIEMAPAAATLIPLWNLTNVVAAERRPVAELDSLLGEVMRRFPIVAPLARLRQIALHGRYAMAADSARSTCDLPPLPRMREECITFMADMELAQGRVREHGWHLAHAAASAVQRGAPNTALTYVARVAAARASLLGDREGATHVLDSALAAQPLEAIPEANRPYPALAWAHALAGREDAARTFLAAAERRWEESDDRSFARDREMLRAVVALASDRPGDALDGLRAAVDHPCVFCGGARSGIGAPLGFGANAHALLAHAHDMVDHADSALAHHERFLDAAQLTLAGIGLFAAGSHRRIGELAEARGDTARAAAAYGRFVQLWKDADPELQPTVREVSARLARLARPGAASAGGRGRRAGSGR